MILRMLIDNEKLRTDEFCNEFIRSIKNSNAILGHNNTFPNEVILTLTARAMNKYNDFVLFLMLSEQLSYDNYHRLIAIGKEEIHKTIIKTLNIYEEELKGKVSMFLFSSILEDSLTTTITPVLDAISQHSKLRKNFISDPKQLLTPISAHMGEKVRSAIYLSNALIKISSK